MPDLEGGMPDPRHDLARRTQFDLEHPDPRTRYGGRLRRSLTATAPTVVVAMIAIAVVRIGSVDRTDPVVTPGDDQAPTFEPTATPATTTPAVTPLLEAGADLYLVDPETGRAKLLLASEGDQQDPERSPNCRRVVYESQVRAANPRSSC